MKDLETGKYILSGWLNANKEMLIEDPLEIIDDKGNKPIKRIDCVDESLLTFLEPQLREDIINNEEYKGNRWKSDAYSLGLILLECMLLKEIGFLSDL